MNKLIRTAAGVIIAAILGWLGYSSIDGDGQAVGTAPAAIQPADDYGDAAERILAAFNAQRSDLWIEAGGRVQRVLADDSEGSRHQRFIVRLPNDHTVLIAHNIDLAQRVPLKAGDPVSFYGEYEWNDRGGVVHWTHHDPRGRRDGGWIEHKGTVYR